MSLDDAVIFKGEISQASGTNETDAEFLGDVLRIILIYTVHFLLLLLQ